jgi:hypothetical protein
MASALNPLGGLAGKFRHHPFENHGWAMRPSLSRSPKLQKPLCKEKTVWDRNRRLIELTLLAEASLEPDERLSTHPALRASDTAVDETALLNRLVRPILASVRVRIDDARRYAFASLAGVERRSTQG